ncbi:hypothetical protein [Salsipaludibacter albus]|uniref:hypothetical protein n=1 Tax=Salsipaludibacter albus TaxID=2849650 RepID=UPI001EE4772A|nr:hypothetical protein [Salsipaludibacter albus]MBY5161915.1 hypothetical protein [Salsipaludibacter albus]
MGTNAPRSDKDVEAARTRRSQLFVFAVLTLLAAGVAVATGVVLQLLRTLQGPW